MQIAEHYATPVHGYLGGYFQRVNDYNDKFAVRWGKIEFDMFFGVQANLKVILKVYRDHGLCETYIVDTDAFDIQWDRHKRCTRDFYILPFSNNHGPINCIKFSFVVHRDEHSIPSQNDYIFMDNHQAHDALPQYRKITGEWATTNNYRTYELNAAELQSDVDWYNHHFESLNLTPKLPKVSNITLIIPNVLSMIISIR